MTISKKLTGKQVHLLYWVEIDKIKYRQDRTGLIKHVGSKSIIFEPFQHDELSLSIDQINSIEELQKEVFKTYKNNLYDVWQSKLEYANKHNLVIFSFKFKGCIFLSQFIKGRWGDPYQIEQL